MAIFCEENNSQYKREQLEIEKLAQGCQGNAPTRRLNRLPYTCTTTAAFSDSFQCFQIHSRTFFWEEENF
jgi:hypothetical protein